MGQRSTVLISPHWPRPMPGTNRLSSIWRLSQYASFTGLVVTIGLIAGLASRNPMTAGMVIGLLLVAPIIWNRPAMGAYLLIGGVAVFEAFPLGFQDSVTDQTLFFQTISSAHDLKFLVLSGAEILIVLTLGTVALRRMAVGSKPLELGPLFWPIGVYAVVVGFGLVYGLGRDGYWETALNEARSQAYIFLVYLLVVNTIHERRQVNRMLWLFLIGVAIKGLIGTWRYMVTLGGDLTLVEALSRNTNSILSHEESYLFALFFLLALILFLFRGHRGQLLFILLAAAPILIAFVANQRRSGSLVLIIGILVVIGLSYLLTKSRRRTILLTGIALVIALPAYLAVTWNGQSLAAEPARAVRSLFSPGGRDAASNDYRRIEALNLKYNIQDRPLLGSGFGHPMSLYIPLPWIGDRFNNWDVVPHNTILWVWMRLGIVGFTAFWFLLGRSIVAAIMAAKRVSDPFLQSVCAFTVVALITWVFMGMVDMGIVDFRATVLIGLLIGLVSRIPQMVPNTPSKKSLNHGHGFGTATQTARLTS